MKTRFDLEQEILDCWHIVDDVKTLYENLSERCPTISDDALNILLGISSLYQMKFEKAFGTFEDLIRQEAIDKAKPVVELKLNATATFSRWIVKVTYNNGKTSYVAIGSGSSTELNEAHIYTKLDLAEAKAKSLSEGLGMWYKDVEVIPVQVSV